jgi:hypothetical protein
LDDIAFDDLEDRVDVGERFLIYLILAPIEDLLARLFSRREQILYDKRFVGKLLEILIRELRGLGLSFVYLLGLRFFLTLLELGRI